MYGMKASGQRLRGTPAHFIFSVDLVFFFWGGGGGGVGRRIFFCGQGGGGAEGRIY